MPHRTPPTAEPDTPPDPSQDQDGAARPTRIGLALRVARVLLGFGRHFIETVQQRAAVPSFDALAVNFGTANLTTILAHLNRGILRAMALERVLLARIAAGRDLPMVEPGSRPRTPRLADPPEAPAAATPETPAGDPAAAPPLSAEAAAPAEASRPPRRAATRPSDRDDPVLVMPTLAELEAQIRRRGFGRTIVDICLDLGVVPGLCTRDFWNALFECIQFHGGSLVTLMRERERRYKTFLQEWDRRPGRLNRPTFQWWSLSREAIHKIMGFFLGEVPFNPCAPAPAACAVAAATGPP